MKRKRQTALLVGALAWMVFVPEAGMASASVTLAWNPSTDPNVAGYDIYYGGASHTYTNSIWVGAVTNATISGLTEGATYFFAAKARNASGLESSFSNEASYTVPLSTVKGQRPEGPLGDRRSGTAPLNAVTPQPTLGRPSRSNGQCSLTVAGASGYQCVIQVSTDLVNWVSVQTNAAPFTFVDTHAGQFSRRFYRAFYNP